MNKIVLRSKEFLILDLDDAHKRIKHLELMMKRTASRITNLAYKIPPPNKYTPKFIQLVIELQQEIVE